MALVRHRRRPLPVAAAATLGKAMGYLAKNAPRAYKRRRTGNPAPAAMADTSPLTGQFDYKTDYRKRRIGRRRRRVIKRKRRWRRKVVNTVRNANVGSTQIHKISLGLLNTGSGLSDACSFGLYGQNGNQSALLNSNADIREFFREISNTDWNNQITTAASQNHKIYAMHATMEMTIRNRGTTDAIIEAYYIRGRRPAPVTLDSVTGNPNGSPVQVYADAFAKMALASDPNTGNSFDAKPTFKTVGITPFQAPNFCRHYNIYKRQKFRVPPGNEISMMIHDRRPRTFTMMNSQNRHTDRSYHGILFQQQGSPDDDGATQTSAQVTSVTYMSIRRYRIKMFRDNLEKTATDISGS